MVTLTLKDERRLRVFENRMLRRIVDPIRDELTGEWRKLHNEELNDQLTKYCTGDKIEENEMGGACSTYGEKRGVYKDLVGKPEGNRPLGSPRRRWQDNIKMQIQEVGCGGMDWFELAQDRDRWRALVSTVMNLRVS